MATRVVLIHNFLAPFRNPLFEELARRFDLEVWILGDIGVIREWDMKPSEMNFRCRRIAGATLGIGSRYNALLLNYALPRELAKSDAEVVICCGWDSPAAFYCGLWARCSPKPFILWSGSTAAETSKLRTWTTPIVRWLVRSANAWIADGSRAATYLASLGATSERTFPAFNAVDNAFYWEASRLNDAEKAAVRSQLGEDDGPVLIYVGNLLALKGVFELVEAFAIFGEHDATAQLFIVGEGGDGDTLRSRCVQLGITDRVVFTGFMEADEIAKCFGIADLLVLASRQEIWGMVINEALASGVPVLATDVCGAIADLVEEGVNGYVVPSGDAEVLADAMIRHFSAPETHEQMRAAARDRIASFTVNAAADTFERAVAAVLPSD